MVLKEIELGEVDLADESFRITERLDSEPLLESLQAIGQLNPVVLREKRTRLAVVCGFRRVHALERLGVHRVLARVFSEDELEPARLFHLALWDNLSHRQFDPLEKARALSKLRDRFGVSKDVLVRVYLTMLGLSPHESVLRSFILLDGVHPGLRKCLADGRLTTASVEAMAQMSGEFQQSIASLMDRIRLSASMQKKVLDVLADLAAIEGAAAGRALDDPEVLAIVHSGGLSPFQKGEKLFEFLYRRRNPRLAQAARQFFELSKSLGLPGSVKITADPFFENPGVRVEFHAPNVERFREFAAALEKAAHTEAAEGLFQI